MGKKCIHIVILLVLNAIMSVQAGVAGGFKGTGVVVPGSVADRLHTAPPAATGTNLSIGRQTIRRYHIKVRFLGGCCGFIAGFQATDRPTAFLTEFVFAIRPSSECCSDYLNLHPLRGPPLTSRYC
jgi:hypothetical protein